MRGRALTAVVVLAVALALTALPASPDVVTREIALPNGSQPVPVLMAYLASNGAVNGHTGYVFAASGSQFKLESLGGAGGLPAEFDIYFYDNPRLVSGAGLPASCGYSFGSQNPKEGIVCGTHVVIVMAVGLLGKFRYTST